jgi:hypothetical protein
VKGHAGEWLQFVEDHLDYSDDTARRLIDVHLLGQRFSKLRNLRLAKTTLYALCGHGDWSCGHGDWNDYMEAIVAELVKRASKMPRLKHSDAERFIAIAVARSDYGDKYHDAALYAMYYETHEGEKYEYRLAALKAANPETEEAVDKVIKGADLDWLRAVYGEGIPDDIPDDVFETVYRKLCTCADTEHAPKLLKKLLDLPRPWTLDAVDSISLLDPPEDEEKSEIISTPSTTAAHVQQVATKAEQARPRQQQPVPGDIGPMFDHGAITPDFIDEITDCVASPAVSAALRKVDEFIDETIGDLDHKDSGIFYRLAKRMIDECLRELEAPSGSDLVDEVLVVHAGARELRSANAVRAR